MSIFNDIILTEIKNYKNGLGDPRKRFKVALNTTHGLFGAVGAGLGAGAGRLVGGAIGKHKAKNAATEEEREKIINKYKRAGTAIGAGAGAIGGVGYTARAMHQMHKSGEMGRFYKDIRRRNVL